MKQALRRCCCSVCRPLWLCSGCFWLPDHRKSAHLETGFSVSGCGIRGRKGDYPEDSSVCRIHPSAESHSPVNRNLTHEEIGLESGFHSLQYSSTPCKQYTNPEYTSSSALCHFTFTNANWLIDVQKLDYLLPSLQFRYILWKKKKLLFCLQFYLWTKHRNKNYRSEKIFYHAVLCHKFYVFTLNFIVHYKVPFYHVCEENKQQG